MDVHTRDRSDDVLPPLDADERSPNSVVRERSERVPNGVHAPRLLERCSAVATLSVASLGCASTLAMAVPHLAPIAIDLMLGSTVAIVATMIVASVVVIRTSRRADRSGFTA
jgi:hypothetical protein